MKHGKWLLGVVFLLVAALALASMRTTQGRNGGAMQKASPPEIRSIYVVDRFVKDDKVTVVVLCDQWQGNLVYITGSGVAVIHQPENCHIADTALGGP